MARLKIGVLIDSLRLGVREGIRRAAELGFDGFQVYVTGGELAPEAMTRSARREFRTLVTDSGLELSALCVELGGYTDEASVDERVERTRRMLDLGVDLGARVHTAHIGRIPDDPAAKARRTLAAALEAIGTYAAEHECCFACETGPEDTPLMRDFLAALACEGLKVNYDPANLVMKGYDVVRGVYALAPLIVHTHAKDGIRRPDGSRQEVPVGKGQVPWESYVAALREVGYEGFFTIERESGDDPVADAIAAKRFLERL